MAISSRVLFFVFSAFLWGQACSAPTPVPMPAHSPVPGEIVRIKPSDTNGPQVGGGAHHEHYYVALGPHPTDPNRHMVAGISHHGNVGLLGPNEPVPAGSHGLTGDVLLAPTSAHVQHISRTQFGQRQGVVSQQWINNHHQMQRQAQYVQERRNEAAKTNDKAADAHNAAHQAHTRAAQHAQVGEHRDHHQQAADHHLNEARRHKEIAQELRYSPDHTASNGKAHIEAARLSHNAALGSGKGADHSHHHAQAALSHMAAAGAHQNARDDHHAASQNPAIHPTQAAHHRTQAIEHNNQLNAHRQSAAAHSPAQNHNAPDPRHSAQQAENSRLRAVQSQSAARRRH